MAEVNTKKRPKNLDLLSIRLPLPAKVSILHRISGAGLFLCLPVLLWLFQASVTSQEGYDSVRSLAGMLPVQIILGGLIWAFVHHFCAGIRFLLLDLHIGVEKQQAVMSSVLVFAVSLPLTALVIWRVLL